MIFCLFLILIISLWEIMYLFYVNVCIALHFNTGLNIFKRFTIIFYYMKEDQKHFNISNSFLYRMKKGNQRSKLNKNNEFMSIFNTINLHQSPNRELQQTIKQLREENHGKKYSTLNSQSNSLNLKNGTKKQLPMYPKIFLKIGKPQIKSRKHIKQLQNHPNNMNLMLTTGFQQPRCQSLEVIQNRKTMKDFHKPFQYREGEPKPTYNPQIQFYNTNSIFIYKKVTNQCSSEMQANHLNDGINWDMKSKSAIKYNKRRSLPLDQNSQIPRPSRSVFKKFNFNEGEFTPMQQQFIINKSSIQGLKNYSEPLEGQLIDVRHIRSRRKTKQIIKTQENKFIEGKQTLQPWDIHIQQQGHLHVRGSPFNQN